MIVKAGPQLRGGRTHGLLAYLLGPGRHTDHIDPRVITGWVPVDFLPGSDVDAAGRVPICRVLTEHDVPIAPNSYYGHKKRPPSPRTVRVRPY